ncbi:PAS domain-containing protein [Halobaculum roseum]|nr:PAS domain-containing protein [Halobaculum roseum]QZY02311.1 PAS domain-containing protein [Halobaculum roseum]
METRAWVYHGALAPPVQYGMPGLEAFLDNAHDRIVLIDADGVYRYANAATELVVGYEPSEIVGTVERRRIGRIGIRARSVAPGLTPRRAGLATPAPSP